MFQKHEQIFLILILFQKVKQNVFNSFYVHKILRCKQTRQNKKREISDKISPLYK